MMRRLADLCLAFVTMAAATSGSFPTVGLHHWSDKYGRKLCMPGYYHIKSTECDGFCCAACPEGTYSSHYNATRCKPCKHCLPHWEVTVRVCTSTLDTICGSKVYRYQDVNEDVTEDWPREISTVRELRTTKRHPQELLIELANHFTSNITTSTDPGHIAPQSEPDFSWKKVLIISSASISAAASACIVSLVIYKRKTRRYIMGSTKIERSPSITENLLCMSQNNQPDTTCNKLTNVGPHHYQFPATTSQTHFPMSKDHRRGNKRNGFPGFEMELTSCDNRTLIHAKRMFASEDVLAKVHNDGDTDMESRGKFSTICRMEKQTHSDPLVLTGIEKATELERLQKYGPLKILNDLVCKPQERYVCTDVAMEVMPVKNQDLWKKLSFRVPETLDPRETLDSGISDDSSRDNLDSVVVPLMENGSESDNVAASKRLRDSEDNYAPTDSSHFLDVDEGLSQELDQNSCPELESLESKGLYSKNALLDFEKDNKILNKNMNVNWIENETLNLSNNQLDFKVGSYWDVGTFFSSNGGILKKEKSDCYLEVPEGAVPVDKKYFICNKTIVNFSASHNYTTQDEWLVAPILEYEAPGPFQKYVKIVIPHSVTDPSCLPHIKVYWREDRSMQEWTEIPSAPQSNNECPKKYAVVTDTVVEVYTVGFCQIKCACGMRPTKNLVLNTKVFARYEELDDSSPSQVLVLRTYLCDQLMLRPDFMQEIEKNERCEPLPGSRLLQLPDVDLYGDSSVQVALVATEWQEKFSSLPQQAVQTKFLKDLLSCHNGGLAPLAAEFVLTPSNQESYKTSFEGNLSITVIPSKKPAKKRWPGKSRTSYTVLPTAGTCTNVYLLFQLHPYRRSNMNLLKQDSPSHKEHDINADDLDLAMHLVATEIQREKIRNFAVMGLRLSLAEVERLMADNDDTYSKASAVMRSWRMAGGEAADLESLVDTLRSPKVQLTLLADKIETNFKTSVKLPTDLSVTVV